MRSAKSDYETNVIQSFANRNSSKIYKYITRQNSIPPTFNFESSFATSDRDRASLFNAQSLPTVFLHYHHLIISWANALWHQYSWIWSLQHTAYTWPGQVLCSCLFQPFHSKLFNIYNYVTFSSSSTRLLLPQTQASHFQNKLLYLSMLAFRTLSQQSVH